MKRSKPPWILLSGEINPPSSQAYNFSRRTQYDWPAAFSCASANSNSHRPDVGSGLAMGKLWIGLAVLLQQLRKLNHEFATGHDMLCPQLRGLLE